MTSSAGCFVQKKNRDLGTVVDLDSLSKPVDCGFQRSKVTGTGSASLHIFGLSPNPRRRTFADIYPRRRNSTVARICIFTESTTRLVTTTTRLPYDRRTTSVRRMEVINFSARQSRGCRIAVASQSRRSCCKHCIIGWSFVVIY